MKPLVEDADELRLQTEGFIKSEFGKYVMTALEGMQDNNLLSAQHPECTNPVRYIDRAAAIKEVIEFIRQPV